MAEVIMLPARLDLAEAPGLTAELQSRVGSGHIALDASAVTHFGALCAQAVLSASTTLRAADGSLEILNASDRAKAQLEVMGLSVETLMEGAV